METAHQIANNRQTPERRAKATEQDLSMEMWRRNDAAATQQQLEM
jgi:hypothetical protein